MSEHLKRDNLHEDLSDDPMMEDDEVVTLAEDGNQTMILSDGEIHIENVRVGGSVVIVDTDFFNDFPDDFDDA